MIDLGHLLFEVCNALLLVSWCSLAFMLWRVRNTKILNGGEWPVVATLISFAVVRFLQMFGWRPWEMPVIIAAVAGLTIVSTVILVNVLHRFAQSEKVEDKIVVKLPPPVAELYMSLKRNGGGGA